MCSIGRSRWFAAVGFPIRISSDHSLYTAPRGFSQCPTSFFGIWRLGIHHKPFVASLRDAEISILLSSSLLRASSSTCVLHSIRLVRCPLFPPSLAQVRVKRFQRLTAGRCLSSISFRNTCWPSTIIFCFTHSGPACAGPRFSHTAMPFLV